MTFVADFTPEQLQNASAGRRYGQGKREAQEAAMIEVKPGILKCPHCEYTFREEDGHSCIAQVRQQLAEAEAEMAGDKKALADCVVQMQRDEAEIARLKEEFADVLKERNDIGRRYEREMERADSASHKLSALTAALSALLKEMDVRRFNLPISVDTRYWRGRLAALLDSLKGATPENTFKRQRDPADVEIERLEKQLVRRNDNERILRQQLENAEAEIARLKDTQIGGGETPSYEDNSIREWRCGCYEDQGGYHFCSQNHSIQIADKLSALTAALSALVAKWRNRYDHYDPEESEHSGMFWSGAKRVTEELAALLDSLKEGK